MSAGTVSLERLRRRRRIGFVFLVAVFAAPLLPQVKGQAFLIGWMLCSSIVGLSMNVLAGYAGQISLAQAVLFGTGAFTLANLVTFQGVPWLIALPSAGLVTAAISLAIGFPALRIRGLNLAIATLGFQFVMHRIVFRTQFLTRGAAGVEVDSPKLFGYQFDTIGRPHTFLWVILVVYIAIWMLDRNLTRSRAGRAFHALRQDEQVAASFGIAISRYKLLAFALSGFYAGTAGGLFGTLLASVDEALFDYTVSIEFLVFAVLGGLGSRAGTAIGAAFPVLYRRVFSNLASTGAALGGLLLVFTLIRYQGGMAAQGRDLREAAQRASLFKWRGIAVFAGSVVASIGGGILAGVLTYHAFRIAAPGWPLRNMVIAIVALGASTVITDASRRIGPRIVAKLMNIPAELLEPGAIVPPPPPAPAALLTSPEALAFARPRTEREAEPSSGSLLEVRGLAMHFGGVRALEDVSLRVEQGELIGIMGPNGSGKTTMLNCISGFLTPTRGSVLFRGREITKLAPHDRSQLGLARTFQNIGLVKSETVYDNFLIAQHNVCGYGALEGLMRTGVVAGEEHEIRLRALEAIERLGLGDVAQETVGSLPHGRAKLVEIGCALVSGPEILLLDEPAAGVAPQEAEALGEMLKAVSTHLGVTILMIDHNVPLMLSTCDYLYVLNFGQVLAEGSPAEVAAHPDVVAAYLGTGAMREEEHAAPGL